MRRPVGVKGYFCFFVAQGFSSAESPLSPPFHPHSSRSDFCSLGASWVFSVQPVLPPDFRPCFDLLASNYEIEAGQAIDAVTGTRLWAFAFPFAERF
jgi:hypothetical protein